MLDRQRRGSTAGNLIATLDELQADGLIRRKVDPVDRRRRVVPADGTGVRVLHPEAAASERADMRFSAA